MPRKKKVETPQVEETPKEVTPPENTYVEDAENFARFFVDHIQQVPNQSLAEAVDKIAKKTKGKKNLDVLIYMAHLSNNA
jgi:hypothetical protein